MSTSTGTLEGFRLAAQAQAMRKKEALEENEKINNLLMKMGEGGQEPAPRRQRADGGERKNKESVYEAAEAFFKENPGDHTRADVAVGIIKRGYVTNSSEDDFINTAYAAIRKLIEDGKVETVGTRPNTKYRSKK